MAEEAKAKTTENAVQRLKWLHDLVAETMAFDEEAFPPRRSKKDTEQEIGVLPPDLRKVYATMQFYGRERDLERVKIKYVDHGNCTERCPESATVQEANAKHGVLQGIFWACLYDHFRLWDDKRDHQVCREWVLVAIKDDDEDGDSGPEGMPEPLARIMKILSGARGQVSIVGGKVIDATNNGSNDTD